MRKMWNIKKTEMDLVTALPIILVVKIIKDK